LDRYPSHTVKSNSTVDLDGSANFPRSLIFHLILIGV